MKLAVNYSPEAANLLRAGAADVDIFKCPDWAFDRWREVLDAARPLRPVYIHFNHQAGRGEMATTDWGAVRALRDETQTPFVNIHLAPIVRDFPGIAFDDVSEDAADRVARAVIADVALAARQFGPEHVIVENIPYWANPKGFMRLAVEPSVMRRVLDETGCGFLLDLSHARIAAHYLGRDVKEYIEEFPIERLRELHNTGLGMEGPRLMDHLPLTDEDWEFFDWALGCIQSGAWPEPWALAYEYGGIGPKFEHRSEQTALAADLPRFWGRLEPLRQPAG